MAKTFQTGIFLNYILMRPHFFFICKSFHVLFIKPRLIVTQFCSITTKKNRNRKTNLMFAQLVFHRIKRQQGLVLLILITRKILIVVSQKEFFSRSELDGSHTLFLHIVCESIYIPILWYANYMCYGFTFSAGRLESVGYQTYSSRSDDFFSIRLNIL